MRPALVLCFLLVACQNDTDARLKRVEKELADIKANPPVETITVPAPTTLPPPAPASTQGNALRQDVAEDCVRQGVCAFIPAKDDPTFGLIYASPQGVTTLFRWDVTKMLYMAVTDVQPVTVADHRLAPSESERSHLQDLLLN